MAITERLAILIEAHGGGAVASEFRKVGAAAKEGYGKASTGAQEASQKTNLLNTGLQKLGINAGISGGALKTALAGGAVAAGAAIAALAIKGVSQFAGLASEIRGVQRAAGGTTEAASKLRAEGDALGVSTETLSGAMFKLGKAVELNPTKLAAVGVQVARNAQGNVDLYSTLENVRLAYQQQPDAAGRAALAFAAFGKQGLALTPILAATSERLHEIDDAAQRHHEILSADDLAKAKAYNISVHELGDAFKGLELELGRGIVPALTQLFVGLEKIVEVGDKAGHAIGSVFDANRKSSVSLSELSGPAAEKYIKHLQEQQKSQEAANHAMDFGTTTSAEYRMAQEGAAKAVEIHARDAENAAKQIDLLTKAEERQNTAVRGSIDAQIGVEKAQQGLTQALTDFAEKQKEATKAKGKDAAANEAVIESATSLKTAYLDIADAAVKQADQQAQVAGRTLDAATKNEIFKQKLEQLAATLAPGSAIRTALQAYIDQLRAIPNTVTTTIAVRGSGAGTSVVTGQGGTPIQRRAGGGPVSAGRPYMVGERGMELFVPDQSGNVVSNSATDALRKAGITADKLRAVADDPRAVVALLKKAGLSAGQIQMLANMTPSQVYGALDVPSVDLGALAALGKAGFTPDQIQALSDHPDLIGTGLFRNKFSGDDIKQLNAFTASQKKSFASGDLAGAVAAQRGIESMGPVQQIRQLQQGWADTAQTQQDSVDSQLSALDSMGIHLHFEGPVVGASAGRELAELIRSELLRISARNPNGLGLS